MVSWEFRCCKNMLLFFKCAVSSRQKSKKRLVNEHRWVSPAPNGWQSWELFSQTCQYTANSPQTRDWVPNLEHIPSTPLCIYNGFMLDLQIDCWARKNWLEIVVVVLFFLWNSDIVYTENTIQSFRFWFKDFHGKWKKRENEKRCISIGDTRFMLVFLCTEFNWKFLSWKLFNQNFPVEEWHILCQSKHYSSHMKICRMHFWTSGKSNEQNWNQYY